VPITLQIVRHGIVESYVIPKHLIDDLLLKMAVLECDNKRLLGEHVVASIEVPKLPVGYPLNLKELLNAVL
jgi:hypothetical protein